MVAIPPTILVECNDEQVRAGHLIQGCSRTLPADHLITKWTRHLGQHRGLEHELPLRRREAGQNFFSQEIEDVTVAAPERLDKVVYVLLALHGERGQVDPCRPPLCAIEQHTKVVSA